MKTPLRLLKLVAGVAWLASCGGGSTGATCPPESTLTYENFGRPFMQSYCLRCHSSSLTGGARKFAPASHNFDTAQDVKQHRVDIDARAGAGPAGVRESMPPDGPKPSEEERRKLAQWLACGAP